MTISFALTHDCCSEAYKDRYAGAHAGCIGRFKSKERQELLKATGKLHTRSGSRHRFKTYRGSRAVCAKFPLREQGLTAKSQSTNDAWNITRLEHATAVEANHDNLYNSPGVYQQRQAIVEHFGTLKRQWTGYCTLLRGKE